LVYQEVDTAGDVTKQRSEKSSDKYDDSSDDEDCGGVQSKTSKYKVTRDESGKVVEEVTVEGNLSDAANGLIGRVGSTSAAAAEDNEPLAPLQVDTEDSDAQLAAELQAAGGGFEITGGDGDIGPKKDGKGGFGKWDLKSDEGSDKLNLGGLLEVLDGVVDCPGRILIMTTNHPKKLDKALIRPGRVNQRLFLDYICLEDALNMIQHYYFWPNTDDAARLDELSHSLLKDFFTNGLKLLGFGVNPTSLSSKSVEAGIVPAPCSDAGMDDSSPQLSPAEVEQLCVEHSTIHEMIVGLVKGVGVPGSIAEDLRQRAKRRHKVTARARARAEKKAARGAAFMSAAESQLLTPSSLTRQNSQGGEQLPLLARMTSGT
jgi:hypothetical protein